jgi:hypothetical protein
MTILQAAGVLSLITIAVFARPAPEPALFGEGVISTSADEVGMALSPDGKDAYFVRRTPITVGSPLEVICHSHLQGGTWTTPEIAAFSGQYRDLAPAMAPDGSKLFFISNRPEDDGSRAGDAPRSDFDIWFVERSGAGWSPPEHLGPPVNSPAQEYGVSVAANGTLYFASNRPGGKGTYDIYRSRWTGDGYQAPENLGDAINTDGPELLPAVSPDERLLVFAAYGRPDEIVGVHGEYNKGDLYVSNRVDGIWSRARNAGPRINSGAGESAPAFSADGKWLFFVSERGFATYRLPRRLTYRELQNNLTRTRNGMGNVYQIASAALPLPH